MRASLDLLRGGAALLVFPEGTRSTDGTFQALRPGFAVLARKAGVPILPVYAGGTFEAWSRARRWPRFTGRIVVAVGEPIPAREVRRGAAITHRVKEAWRSLRDRSRVAGASPTSAGVGSPSATAARGRGGSPESE